MTEHTAFETSLHDYLSGDLPVERRAEMDGHLAVCPRCRRDAAELRDVLLAAATLPAAVEPARDLWPEIEARLTTRDDRAAFAASSVEGPPPGARRPARGLADLPRHGGARAWWAARVTWATWSGWAVATALVAYLVLTRPPTTDQRQAARETDDPELMPAAAMLFDLRGLEGGSVQAHDEFAAALGERSEDLAPETLSVIEGNLRLIDTAISETRAALTADPYNAHLARRLADGYQDRIALLRRAAWLTVRS